MLAFIFLYCTYNSDHYTSFAPDSNKNVLALKVISHIITHCCWMNIHLVQPHDCVLEIRVAEGYGARWSRDGSKVPLVL